MPSEAGCLLRWNDFVSTSEPDPLYNAFRGTFPSKVTVNFVTGVRKFKTLSPKDLSVIVDYNEIKSHPSDKCVLYLRGVPHGVSRASLNVQQVDYLIENEE